MHKLINPCTSRSLFELSIGVEYQIIVSYEIWGYITPVFPVCHFYFECLLGSIELGAFPIWMSTICFYFSFVPKPCYIHLKHKMKIFAKNKNVIMGYVCSFVSEMNILCVQKQKIFSWQTNLICKKN